ncbi:MAG TPA: 3'-5' exonuclease [Gemmatimonadaceae bacterium]|nr:3'-5' exonuclease [Gemmatimonadaceae bacterium]
MGITTRAIETLLTERAMDFLAGGPAEAVALIEHVCQMPGAPRVVAEQMAVALFAGQPEFARDDAGRWCLASRLTTTVAPAVPAPAAASAGPRDELEALSYVVVDVETTGTSPWHGDRITEVAAVVVRNGVVTDTFETLVNPERPIPPMITSLTNISWEMVKDAPRFRDVCDELLRVLEGHVFVAHNVEFDWRFVSSEVERATGRRLDGPRLCTVRLARRLLPQLRSRRLDSVAHFYDVEISGRHRAGGDALATARVLLHLLNGARERECRSWDDLQRLLGARARGRRPRRPPAMPHPVDKDTTA